MTTTKMIPRAQLIEPPQPIRLGMDEQALGDLADSIKRHGLLHPLIVVPCHLRAENDHTTAAGENVITGEVLQYRYEIVDGHRRWIAAGVAGVDPLECKVYESLDDAKFGVMLDANAMREDITPAEEGAQFIDLAEKRGWNMPQLTRYFGRSEQYINERVRLVKDFPDVFAVVARRAINFTQARAIMRCPDPNWRAYMLDQAETHGASARTLVTLVDQWKSMELAKQSQPPAHTPEHVIIQQASEAPACVWCNRSDDPGAIVNLPAHSYHVRDLREFLARVGVNRPAPATGR